MLSWWCKSTYHPVITGGYPIHSLPFSKMSLLYILFCPTMTLEGTVCLGGGHCRIRALCDGNLEPQSSSLYGRAICVHWQQLQSPWLAAEASICVDSCCVCVLFQPNSWEIRTDNYKLSDFLTAVRSVHQVFNSRHNFLDKTTHSHPTLFLGLVLLGFFITENHKCDEHIARTGWILTDPFSITLFNMTTPRLFCSQTISQKWPQVFGKGPCRDRIPRNKHYFL